ncbi:MAG: two-component regulator propeller domain-containing protein [Bacteroidota bacterium]
MRQKILFCFSLIFFLLQATQKISAQSPGFKSFFFAENSIRIFSLFKNKEGYLLTGGSNGINKFDGIHFNEIKTNIPSRADTATAIFQDNKNDLWIGYQSGRIAKTIAGRLTYIEPDEGTPKKRVTSFIQDRENNTWFGTRGEGIYYFKEKRLFLINEENGLTDLNIHSLSLAANGDVLAATDQGINICTLKGTKATVTVISPSNGLPDYIVTVIIPAGNNTFWIGLQDKGVCLYDHTTGKISVPSILSGWHMSQVNDLKFTHGNLWIATQDSGLICYNTSKNVLTPAVANWQKTVNKITEDDQGNIWLLSDNNSLVRSSSNALQFYQLFTESFSETVHTIIVDHENNFWAGTDMAIVKYTYNGSKYVSKKYPVSGLDIKTDITSLHEDAFHNIWIGTMGKGVFVLDPFTGKTRQLKEALPSGSILSITGKGNTVCTAGLEGAIIFELSPINIDINNNYSFTVYNKIETIGSTYIYNVFKDSKNRIWFATDGKGLTMLNNGIYTHYNESNGIKDLHIYSVTEDKKGNIWFGTSNAGVYFFDGKIFANYGIKEGLSSLLISVVRADKQGNIVVVNKEGLDIINPATGNISYINAVQGVTGINDALGAVCTDADGNIFIGTSKAIVSYTALNGINNTPKTVIETVQLFLNDIDTAAINYFKYDENNIRFNFGALYYTDPENVFFEYKLEGVYTNWQFTSDNTKAFPKLPPGKYVFKVRSSLNKNFNNASEASFAFEIGGPFWRTWWFITGCLLTIIGLLYWYIKKRERNLQHVERLQGEKIKFEFEVLRNQVNPHFLFNSFNTLISTIEENPKMGVEYVEHLSDFFRNIVNYRDKNTISLREEITLLQSYLYLQQKRYGSNLQLAVDINDSDKELIFLPPLTLQLLVENAIKHNVVSKEALLRIRLFKQDNCIVVQNNINKKMYKEKGTGMGLQNIVSRYAMLNSKAVEIKETAEHFTVSLPILKQD